MDTFILLETPRAFWSKTAGVPFDRCVVCNKHLLEKGVDHLVEKAFRGGELLYEYATCAGCFDWLEGSLSVSSRWLCDDWLARNVDFEARFQKLMRVYPNDVAPWIANCAVTGTPVAELEEYQIEAVCCGTDLVLCHLPYAISGESVDEMLELLSSDSRRQLDRFTRDYLGVPPALLQTGERQTALAD